MTQEHESGLVIQILERLNGEIKSSSNEFKEALKNDLARLKGHTSAEQLEALQGSNMMWETFKLACRIDQPPKVRQIALDGIQKLIAYGYMTATEPVAEITLPAVTSPSNEVLQKLMSEVDTDFSSSESLRQQFRQIDEIVLAICSSCPVTNGQKTAAASGQAPNLASSPEDSVQLQVLKCLLTVVTSLHAELHGISLLRCLLVCFFIYMDSSNAINQVTAKASLTQMVNDCFSYFQKQTQGDASPVSPDAEVGKATAEQKQWALSDTLSVFKFLCAQALFSDASNAPKLPQEATDNSFDAVTAVSSAHIDHELSGLSSRVRSLALELVLSVMTNVGPVVRDDEPFRRLACSQLPFIISRNAITTTPLLFELSVAVFMLTVQFYREFLKSEIEALLSTLFLHMLETPNAPLSIKLILLQGFQKLSTNPAILADLYLNYDCDLTMSSVFERIVVVVCKLAQSKKRDTSPHTVSALFGLNGTREQDAASVKQDRKLKAECMRCLVDITWSLVLWSRSLVPDLSFVDVMPSSYSYNGPLPLAPGQQTELSPTRTKARRIRADTLKSEAASPTSPQAQPLSSVEGIPIVLSNRNPLQAVSIPRDPAFARVASDSESFTGKKSPSFEELTMRKQLFQQLVKLFKTKPEKAIQMFIKERFIVSNEETGSVASIDTPKSNGSVESLDDDASSQKDSLDEPHKESLDSNVVKNSSMENAIADFLKSTRDLNKKAIGEYLGSGDQFCIRVMYAFVDSLDFADKFIVSALREFLQLFRLPGEAQKIDRIMEKFSDRYCECNPAVFAKADTAYTLAFSIIMLNTDLHSAHIKVKMTRQDFFKNNRGINDNSDLPDAFLSRIYDDISAHEIVLEDERSAGYFQNSLGMMESSLTSQDAYRVEMSHMQKRSQHYLLAKSAERAAQMAPFQTASSPGLAKPMFTVLAWPLMASLAVVFEEAELYSVEKFLFAEACLQTLASCVRLACVFGQETERDAFFTSLCKMTGLQSTGMSLLAASDVKWVSTLRLKAKNVLAVRTLIALANALGDYPQTSWNQILKVFSTIDKLSNVHVGNHSAAATVSNHSLSEGQPEQSTEPAAAVSVDKELPQLPALNVATKESTVSLDSSTDHSVAEPLADTEIKHPANFKVESVTPNPNEKIDWNEKLISELQSQDIAVAIDRVYANTVNFSGVSVVSFFRAMCVVSAEEIGVDPSVLTSGLSGPVSPLGQSQIQHLTQALEAGTAADKLPRMYLLQKMVEIAYYNMNRIRFEWGQIWKVLQPYFNCMGCHPHSEVATYAVDSLRQLCMKFLEKDELSHFHTQSELLRSFEWIVRTTESGSIRELVLQSVQQMIYARSKNLKSGWRSIFAVLSKVAASGEYSMPLAKKSFSILQEIHSTYFAVVVQAGAFVDFVNCLAEFALSDLGKDDETVMKCFMILKQCAELLSQEPSLPVQVSASLAGLSSIAGEFTDSKSQVSLATENSLEDGLASKQIDEESFFLKWFPILSAFSRVIVESKSSLVRATAIDTLFDILRVSGRLFKLKFWKTVFRSVIFPIFEDLIEETPGEQKSMRSGKRGAAFKSAQSPDVNIWIHGIRLLVDLYTELFDMFRSVQDLSVLLLALAKRKEDRLASVGQQCLVQFLRANWIKFGELNTWESVIELIEQAFRITTPTELFTCRSGDTSAKQLPIDSAESVGGDLDDDDAVPLAEIAGVAPSPDNSHGMAEETGVDVKSMDFGLVILKCAVHLELLQQMRDVLMSSVVRQRVLKDGNVVSTEYRLESPVSLSPVSATVSPRKSNVSTHERRVSHFPDKTSTEEERFLRVSRIPALMYVDSQHLHRWILCIYRSFAFAHEFNSDYSLRYAIWKSGLTKQMPNLIKQETIAFSAFIKCLFAIYHVYGDEGYINSSGLVRRGRYLSDSSGILPVTPTDASDSSSVISIAERIVDETTGILEKFVGFLADQTKFQRDIALWSPVIITVYVELLRLDQCWVPVSASTPVENVSPNSEPSGVQLPQTFKTKFNGLRREIITYFRFGIQLMTVERLEVRNILQEFMERVADTFLKIPAAPSLHGDAKADADASEAREATNNSEDGESVEKWFDPVKNISYTDHITTVFWED